MFECFDELRQKKVKHDDSHFDILMIAEYTGLQLGLKIHLGYGRSETIWTATEVV